MTKKKNPGDLEKRGPKAMPINDLSYWMAVKLRMAGRLGRASKASASRASSFLVDDLAKRTSRAGKPSAARDQYNRVNTRRKVDPAYRAETDQMLEKMRRSVAELTANSSEALLLPHQQRRHPKPVPN